METSRRGFFASLVAAVAVLKAKPVAIRWFPALDAGKVLTIRGAANPANNGRFIVVGNFLFPWDGKPPHIS